MTKILLLLLMTGRESEGFESVDLVLSKVLDMLENDGYIMKNGAYGLSVLRCCGIIGLIGLFYEYKFPYH